MNLSGRNTARLALRSLVAIGISWLAASQLAWADGGSVQWVQRQGELILSIFVSPSSPTVGRVDISALLQNATTRQPVTDAEISFRVAPPGGGQAGDPIRATAAAATNKLFRAAILDLPTPGGWRVAVACQASRGEVRGEFDLEVGPPPPRWQAFWPWFSWPFAAVLLFVVHHRLTARGQVRARN